MRTLIPSILLLVRVCLVFTLYLSTVIMNVEMLMSQTSSLFRISTSQTHIIDSLQQALEHVHDNTSRAKTYLRLAWEYRTSSPVESVIAAKRAVTLSEALKNDSLTATAYRFMSVAYRNAGDYIRAAEQAYQALKIDELRKDTLNIGHSYNTIAGILRFQKDVQKSEVYAKQALAIGEHLRNKKLIAYANLNIAEAQHDQGLYGMALISAEKSLRIWQELQDATYQATVKSVMAKEYFAMGKFQESRKYLQEALSTFEKNQQYHNVAQTLNRLAEYSLEIGKIAEAEESALQSIDLSARIEARFYEQEAAKILSNIYQKQKKYKEALLYFQRHETLHDSIYAGIASRTAQLLSIEYDTRQKEQEIEHLRDKDRLNFLTRVMLIAGILMVVILCALLFIRYRRASNTAQSTTIRVEELSNLNAELKLAHMESEAQYREMRLAQLEIHDQNIKLEELNQEKNMILGMVSHDLKNPIVAVQGLSEMMMKEDFSHEQYKEFSGIINETATRMFNLVRTFLDFARMEDGKVRLNPIEFDLNLVVGMIVEEYRRAAEAKSISLHFTPHFEPLRVLADETAAKQVLDNIISNAIKYTAKGKNVAVRILPIQTLPQGLVLMREDIENLDDLQLEARTTHIRVEVMDEGPGMTAEDMNKLFGKFSRLSAQPTGGETSTGLGLAIAKKLTELMHGRIWCDSELGEGSVFYIELPCPMQIPSAYTIMSDVA